MPPQSLKQSPGFFLYAMVLPPYYPEIATAAIKPIYRRMRESTRPAISAGVLNLIRLQASILGSSYKIPPGVPGVKIYLYFLVISKITMSGNRNTVRMIPRAIIFPSPPRLSLVR